MKKGKPVLGNDPLSWMDAPEPGAEASTVPEPVVESAIAAAPQPLLVLPEELTVRAVGDLHARLVEFDPDEREVTIDAGAVALVDTVGVQLLLAWVIDCRSRDLEVRWHDVPAVLTRVSVTLGLADRLGLAAGEDA